MPTYPKRMVPKRQRRVSVCRRSCLLIVDYCKSDDKTIVTKKDYGSYQNERIANLKSKFSDCENIRIFTQKDGGKTFEDELFLANFGNPAISSFLLNAVLPTELCRFFNNKDNGFSFERWKSGLSYFASSSKKVVNETVQNVSQMIVQDPDNAVFYQQLFFAHLFYYYASRSKGDMALNLLVHLQEFKDEKFTIPNYICEGLSWLGKDK
jgi:hypothetical protein